MPSGFVSEQFAVHQPEGTAVVPIFDQRLNWHFYLLYQARGEQFAFGDEIGAGHPAPFPRKQGKRGAGSEQSRS